MNFEEETRARFKSSNKAPCIVAGKIKLSEKWLYNFRNDACYDYHIRKVQKLADYLARVK